MNRWWLRGSLACVLAAGASSVSAHPLLSDRVGALTEQIAARPGDARLLLRRGDHLRHGGASWLALADYVEARKLDPRLVEIDFSIGELMLAADRPTRALHYLERFLAARPDHPAALLSRARALVVAQRPSEAVAAYELALGHLRHPRPDHFLELARLHTHLGQPVQAVAITEAGTRVLGPTTALDTFALEIEIEAGLWDAALDRLGRLATASPRHEHWLTTAAELHETLGSFDLARQAFLDARGALSTRPPGKRRVPALVDLGTRIDSGLARLDQLATPASTTRRRP